MIIKYSDRAKRQIKDRKISVERVTEAVKKPDKKIRSFRNRLLRQKRFGSKMLEVVTVTERSKTTVITAYYLEENDEN